VDFSFLFDGPLYDDMHWGRRAKTWHLRMAFELLALAVLVGVLYVGCLISVALLLYRISPASSIRALSALESFQMDISGGIPSQLTRDALLPNLNWEAAIEHTLRLPLSL
jgi:hypothetical protein